MEALVVLLVVLLVFALIAAVAADDALTQERAKSSALEDALARQTDPERQFAVIRELGEAGRQEVRRLAAELEDSLGSVGQEVRR